MYGTMRLQIMLVFVSAVLMFNSVSTMPSFDLARSILSPILPHNTREGFLGVKMILVLPRYCVWSFLSMLLQTDASVTGRAMRMRSIHSLTLCHYFSLAKIVRKQKETYVRVRKPNTNNALNVYNENRKEPK